MADARGGKRRLPVLPSRDGGGADPERPPWHWALIGALATLLAWIPLAMGAALLARRALARLAPADDDAALRAALAALSASERLKLSLLMVVVPAAGLALAAALGGLLVGRFGGRAGRNEATAAGAAAACVAALATGASGFAAGPIAWLMDTAVIVAIAALSGRGGAILGLRLRGRG
jgi:tRNA-(ms[2]io[6]A)-hydroxylase